MAVKGVIPFLVAMMLLTGVCNTLLTKYQVRWLERRAMRLSAATPEVHAHMDATGHGVCTQLRRQIPHEATQLRTARHPNAADVHWRDGLLARHRHFLPHRPLQANLVRDQ